MDWLTERCKPERKLAALTAYDYPTARLLEEVGVDMILVGDSLGMVFLGMQDTTEVTMEHMLHHTRAVARAVTHTPLVADLPANSYHTPQMALENSLRLIDAGAMAVKLEGPLPEHIATIQQAGIPVIAHLGMLPQQVKVEGGYHIKGKSEGEQQALLAQSKAVATAGAAALVLELVTAELAGKISAAVPVATIGIGSGRQCDGQILVTHDLVGLFPWFQPGFVKPEASLHVGFRQAVSSYIARTRSN